MPRTRARNAALALDLGKAAAVAGAFVLAVGVGVDASGPSPEVTTDRNSATVQGSVAPDLDRKMDRHRCSMTGFGADVLPLSALIEVDDRIRHTTFDEGWAVYTDERPGKLKAVCLDAP